MFGHNVIYNENKGVIMKTVSLNIVDRYNMVKYINQLPCTLAVRGEVDVFIGKLMLTDAEKEKYSVTIDDNGEITPSDDSYVAEIDLSEIGEKFADAIRDFIQMQRNIIEEAEAEKTAVSPIHAKIVDLLSKVV